MRPRTLPILALSHYHYDHTANTNEFASATWLVRQVERDAMFAEKPPDLVQRATFDALRNSKTVIIKTDDYDVFGDGSVVIKWAPGHTPGHQVLFVKLAKTGPVLLSGDLYHYPEERTLDRVPTFDVDPASDAPDENGDRRIPEEEPRTALDPARLHSERRTEERACVLRLSLFT